MSSEATEEGVPMKAEIGDELVVESTEAMSARRTGTIVGLKTADGSPPYLVHWVVGDYDSLIFPGPSTRMEVHHRARGSDGGSPRASRP
jgi:hypothetical protein